MKDPLGFDPKEEWRYLFEEAWPETRQAWVTLVGNVGRDYEDRSPLLRLFHVPALTLPPARTTVADAEEEPGAISDEDDREPPQLITHKLYSKKQQKSDMKAFKRATARAKLLASDPHMRSQPAQAKARVGARVLIYNEYADSKGEPYFEWNPAVVVRGATKQDKRHDTNLKKWCKVPNAWFLCECDCAPGSQPERLFFRLGLRDFKQHNAGDGWVLHLDDAADEPPQGGSAEQHGADEAPDDVDGTGAAGVDDNDDADDLSPAAKLDDE
jgi:hypothetical protein